MRRLCTLLLSLPLALTGGAKDYHVVDYGAVSDTTKLSTEAIQRAVDACAAAGGGRVVIPAGNYKTGTLVLRSHVNLFLENGATLYGSTDLKDYRQMKSDYLSLRTQTMTIQLIYADAVEDVCISGYGTMRIISLPRSKSSRGMMKASLGPICSVSFRARTSECLTSHFAILAVGCNII